MSRYTDACRHGARLDAADKEWHLTSPTPYDPPLSYGGWLQCRSLGTRIISLLNSSPDTENNPPDGSSHEHQGSDQPNGLDPTGKRKRKIIIHTSPFLRCLQTAIAVSSGISQNNQATPQPHNGPHQLTDKCILRVDACLGEWLTPDYYEEITPPPSSDRMIVAAKAELLRRGEDVIYNVDSGSRSATGYFPGGWGSVSTPVSPEVGKPQLPAVNSLQGNRNRAGSYDTVTNPRAKAVLTKLNTNLSHLPLAGYIPPTPGYAISPSDPIPSGYVAHARDACVRVDYPWDSMRNPNWGDGGDYGEEWSSMHGRFRRSLRNMIDWYGEHPSNGNGLGEEDEDTVLVIITHGAGCNALIGALTGEPVLIDVNTASLTMATHIDGETGSPASDLSDDLLQEYSLSLVASTDHLRPGANPSDISSLASPKPKPSSPPSLPSYRHRVPARHQSLSQSPFIIGPSITSSIDSSEWGMSRPSTAPRVTSGGLWGQDGGTDSGDEIVPNFDGPGSTSTPQVNGRNSPVEDSVKKDIPQRTLSQRGLWGNAPLNKDREAAVKRRWTVTERRG